LCNANVASVKAATQRINLVRRHGEGWEQPFRQKFEQLTSSNLHLQPHATASSNVRRA